MRSEHYNAANTGLSIKETAIWCSAGSSTAVVLLFGLRTPAESQLAYAIMRGDSNPAIYQVPNMNANAEIWSSGISGLHPDSQLVVRDDGKLVIYDRDGRSVWKTHT